jgi:hypothetical protein
MRFREHGNDKPVVQLQDRAALEAYLKEQFAPWPDLDGFDLTTLKSERYGDGWLVTLPGYGVVGHADVPV